MSGKIFEREIGRFLETQCCLVIHQVDLRGPRFTTKKTVDYVCCYEDGTFGAIEVKQTKMDSFAFARIPRHQREILATVDKTKYGRAFLALNFRFPKTGCAHLIPWREWSRFEYRWHKKSVRREELREAFREYELVRITGGWKENELGNLFQGMH